MATNVRLIRAGDFVRATLEGRLDLDMSKKLLLEIASAAAALENCEIILDTRKAEVVLSITDLWYLANEMSKLRGLNTRKKAVICPTEHFDRAGFFELCAKNRGDRVRAFTSFDEAFEWLVADASAG
jgi:hypothetical protein